MSKPSRGILYVATGASFVHEAVDSLKEVKKWMPGIPVTIFTDRPQLANGFFENVQTIKRGHNPFLDKVRAIALSPYKKTLFLDTDTYMCQDCRELFELLDRFEIMAAHAPFRMSQYRNQPYPFSGCSEAFPEMNTGVIAYRDNKAVSDFLQRWVQLYQEVLDKNVYTNDQPAFRQAIFESSLSVYILPPEYNFRSGLPAFAGGFAKVKIVHGRNHRIEWLAERINQNENVRVFLPNLIVLGKSVFEILSLPGHVFSRFLAKCLAVPHQIILWMARFKKRSLRKRTGQK